MNLRAVVVLAWPAAWLFGACHLIVGIEETKEAPGDDIDSTGTGGTLVAAVGGAGTEDAGAGGDDSGGAGGSPNAGMGGDAGQAGAPSGGMGGTDAGGTDAGMGGAPGQCGDCSRPGEMCVDGSCVRRGPTVVQVESFWIDSTEVTRAQYAAFLQDMNGDTSGQPNVCAWNTSYDPDEPFVESEGERPAAWIDWCDARAFCEWAGKRLCGDIGGGPLAGADVANEQFDQWFLACGGPTGRYYPYGFSHMQGYCNDEPSGLGALVAVGSLTECQGVYPGVFDMTGNAVEWIDSCEGESGGADTCMVRGGSFIETATASRCTNVPTLARDSRGLPLGFRCCSQ